MFGTLLSTILPTVLSKLPISGGALKLIGIALSIASLAGGVYYAKNKIENLNLAVDLAKEQLVNVKKDNEGLVKLAKQAEEALASERTNSATKIKEVEENAKQAIEDATKTATIIQRIANDKNTSRDGAIAPVLRDTIYSLWSKDTRTKN